MTEQQVRQLVERAIQRTPSKVAQVSLILEKSPDNWFILLRSGPEEFAVAVRVAPEATLQEVEDLLVTEIGKLF